MTVLLEYALNGILLGAVYGVLALPVCMLFSSTGYIDLAIGTYAVLAAAVAYVVGSHFGVTAGVLAGCLAAALAAAVTGVVSLRLDRSTPDHMTVVLASYGISVFIESFVLTFFGEQPMIRQTISDYVSVGGMFVSMQGVVNFGIALLILLACYLILFRTSVGRDMRASAVNAVGAVLAGIPVRRLWYAAYVAGGVLAGVAGILVLHTTGIDYHGGISLLISSFGAAILLGIKHPIRGFVGGLVIGVVQSLSMGYLSGGWVSAVPLVVIFLVLAGGSANMGMAKGGRP